MHTYVHLGVVSKGVYIKFNEVNWDYKSSVPFNALKCKYIINDNHGNILHHFNRYTRPIGERIIIQVIHIRSISHFINAIIENYYIEDTIKFSRLCLII